MAGTGVTLWMAYEVEVRGLSRRELPTRTRSGSGHPPSAAPGPNETGPAAVGLASAISSPLVGDQPGGQRRDGIGRDPQPEADLVLAVEDIARQPDGGNLRLDARPDILRQAHGQRHTDGQRRVRLQPETDLRHAAESEQRDRDNVLARRQRRLEAVLVDAVRVFDGMRVGVVDDRPR